MLNFGEDLSAILAAKRGVQHMDFPSALTILTTITSTGADKSLGDIVVADIPSDAVLVQAKLLLVVGEMENESSSLNRMNIDGTQHIQLKKSGGSYTDAIELVDQMMSIPASGFRGSFPLFGTIDLTAVEVTGNATYNVQWEDAESDGNSLLLKDVYTVLRIYFT